MIEPSCGACINAGPGVTTRPEQVVISAQNRNFPGRSGPGQMYLASPLTVAASAVAGYIVEYEPSTERELAAAIDPNANVILAQQAHIADEWPGGVERLLASIHATRQQWARTCFISRGTRWMTA